MKLRIAGKKELQSFGSYQAVGLAKALRLRDEAHTVLAAHADPGAVEQGTKRREREQSAIASASQADAWIGKVRREGKAPATTGKSEWLLGMASADFGACRSPNP